MSSFSYHRVASISHSPASFIPAFPVRLFDAEFFEAVLERAEGEAEQLGRLRDVVVGLLHGLYDEVALDLFKRDAFGRQSKCPGGCGLRLLPNLKRQVFDRNHRAFAQ